MRLNKTEESDRLNSQRIMGLCMEQIQELTDFSPKNEEEAHTWALIGITLQIIAEKASRFEELLDGENFHQNN